jgi:hypothetical protein
MRVYHCFDGGTAGGGELPAGGWRDQSLMRACGPDRSGTGRGLLATGRGGHGSATFAGRGDKLRAGLLAKSHRSIYLRPLSVPPIRTYPSRTLVYKRAYLVNSQRSLTDMLVSAVQDRPTALSRKLPPDEAGGSQHFINGWKERTGGFWAGTLFQFTKGQHPLGFSLDPAAVEVPVSVLAELAEGTHVLKSALHFGVLDNHVVLMPTSAIRAGDFQNYVNALLRDTGALPEEGAVSLMDEAVPELREQNWKRVKGITLRSNLAPPKIEDTEQTPNGSAGVLKKAVASLSRGRDLVFGDLDASQAIAMERVAVSMTIRYEGRTESLDTTLLDHVASVLKDDPTAQFQLDIEGVGLVTAKQVRVAQKKSIAHDDGRPVPEIAAEKMHLWLREQIDSHRVRP